MAVLIDVKEVPWRILEEVKARILANREAMKRRRAAGDVRGMTRPRPQQRRLGATMTTYRRPEPCPLQFGNEGTTGFAWVLNPEHAGGFNATWAWSRSFGEFDPIIQNDTYTFKVGSGDGGTWVTATISLPGIDSWRDGRFSGLEPFATDREYDGYETDPTGKTISGASAAVDDTDITTFALPCGNGAAIVVVVVRAAGSFGAYGYRATNAMELSYHGGTYWNVYGDYVISTVNNYNVSARGVAAFVVSQTGCRQISLPQQFQSVLDVLTPATTWGGAFVWQEYEDWSVTMQLPVATNPYWYGGDHKGRMFEQAIYSALYAAYGADDQLMEYIDPGYTFDLDTFTPAIYTLFSKYSELFPTLPFDKGLPLGFDYEEGRSSLLDLGCPAPTHVVGLDARAEDFRAINSARWNGAPGYETNGTMRVIYRDVSNYLEGISIVRSETQPKNYPDTLPASGDWTTVETLPLARNRPDVEDTADDFYSILWHYDWGEPQYCRDQLQLLGFTEADMEP